MDDAVWHRLRRKRLIRRGGKSWRRRKGGRFDRRLSWPAGRTTCRCAQSFDSEDISLWDYAKPWKAASDTRKSVVRPSSFHCLRARAPSRRDSDASWRVPFCTRKPTTPSRTMRKTPTTEDWNRRNNRRDNDSRGWDQYREIRKLPGMDRKTLHCCMRSLHKTLGQSRS